ncbi:MAG TPA: hypothetical protein P5044_03715 [bacterium]|nr:hypothetical protein [bacterium]
MTKLIFQIVLFVMVSTYSVFAQEQKPKESGRDIPLLINGGMSANFSALGRNSGFITGDTSFAYFTAIKASLAIDGKWRAGGKVNILSNSIDHALKADEVATVSFTYGGALIGYSFNIKKFFRIETEAMIGGGVVEMVTGKGDNSHSSPFFALEPEIVFLFVMGGHIGLGINISYRLATGMDDGSGYSTADLSGPSAGIDLRVGDF